MKTTFNSIVKEHMALAKEFILSIPDIQQRVISMREGVIVLPKHLKLQQS